MDALSAGHEVRLGLFAPFRPFFAFFALNPFRSVSAGAPARAAPVRFVWPGVPLVWSGVFGLGGRRYR
jgi:hypothetical protein